MENQNVSLHEVSLLLQSQPHTGSPRRRQIHRVAPHLRQQSKHEYDPVMVSLGPYHHGKPELSRAQEFKYVCLDWLSRKNEEQKTKLFGIIFAKIDEIRSCYAENIILDEYDDKQLALMMLLDGCFLLNFIENSAGKTKNNIADWLNCLGLAASIAFAMRDIIVLENQIPFLVIRLLMSEVYEAEEGQAILRRFFTWMTSVDLKQDAVIPGGDDKPPIHLLEACWRILVAEKHDTGAPKERIPVKLVNAVNTSYTCRSVMDLKAKGIHFSPSSSQSLKDIVFKSGPTYGQLQLPMRHISHQSQVSLSNLIAYEVSPSTRTEPVLLSYTSLMKSLIQSTEDVKELQEKGIIRNKFANHEQVVQVYKEINTFGLATFDSFEGVKQGIEEHCRNRAKTWIADLIHTRFQTPWTAVAFFAATLLLCLAFLQALFTIRPVK